MQPPLSWGAVSCVYGIESHLTKYHVGRFAAIGEFRAKTLHSARQAPRQDWRQATTLKHSFTRLRSNWWGDQRLKCRAGDTAGPIAAPTDPQTGVSSGKHGRKKAMGRSFFVFVVAFALTAVGTAAYALDRGLYVGSTITLNPFVQIDRNRPPALLKYCFYLFPKGVFKTVAVTAQTRAEAEAGRCTLFAPGRVPSSWHAPPVAAGHDS